MSRQNKRNRSSETHPHTSRETRVKMSNSRVEVKESLNPAFGLGLFAKKEIRAQKFIADMGGKIILRSTMYSLPEERQGRSIAWDADDALEMISEYRRTTEYDLITSLDLDFDSITEDDVIDKTAIKNILDRNRIEQDGDFRLLLEFLAQLDLVLDVSETESFAKYANDPRGDILHRTANAIMTMSKTGLRFELWSRRNIEAGEEILIDYGDEYFGQ